MIAYFWVALGGALGSVSRYWLAGIATARLGETFPLGTLVVNVTGSLAIGFLAALTESEGRTFATPAFRQLFMVGICGGYTTFSSFSLETLRLVRAGEFLYAGGNIVLSVTLCLAAAWLGWVLGAMFNSMKGN